LEKKCDKDDDDDDDDDDDHHHHHHHHHHDCQKILCFNKTENEVKFVHVLNQLSNAP
jgi:G3E family GTPase